jgi:Tol biopolymer transport system component
MFRGSIVKQLMAVLLTCCAVPMLLATASDSTQQLLWPSDRTGNFDIFVMKADGIDSRNLTDSKARNTDPAWSPDGKNIAFQHTDSGEQNSSLFVMAADGNNPQEIVKTEGPTYNGRPAWKPK